MFARTISSGAGVHTNEQVAVALLVSIHTDGEYRHAALADLALLDITTDQQTDGQAWGETLRLADRYKEILGPLTELWNENVSMAAAACVIARRCQRVSADTALFAGLVSGVGKICLLARGADSRYMMTHPDEFSQVMRDWHAEVAHALLTSWSVAEDVIEAVHGHQTHKGGTRAGLALTDVLSVADVLSEHDITPELRIELLQTQHAAQRLGLRVEDCMTLMGDSQAELALLRNALTF